MAIESDILLSASKAKGKRPYFMDDPMAERALSVAMALAAELSVTQERLATLELLLKEKGILESNCFESYQPNKKELAARGLRQQAMLNRVMRLLRQDVEGIEKSKSEMSCEEIASTIDQA